MRRAVITARHVVRHAKSIRAGHGRALSSTAGGSHEAGAGYYNTKMLVGVGVAAATSIAAFIGATADADAAPGQPGVAAPPAGSEEAGAVPAAEEPAALDR